MFDFKLLTSPAFWFSLHWNPLTRETMIIMVTVFGILFLVGVWFFWSANRIKRDMLIRRARIRVALTFIVSGLGGLLLTFFAYEQIPVFSARFWFLALMVYFIISEVLAVRHLLVIVPRKKSVQGTKAQWGQYFR